MPWTCSLDVTPPTELLPRLCTIGRDISTLFLKRVHLFESHPTPLNQDAVHVFLPALHPWGQSIKTLLGMYMWESHRRDPWLVDIVRSPGRLHLDSGQSMHLLSERKISIFLALSKERVDASML